MALQMLLWQQASRSSFFSELSSLQQKLTSITELRVELQVIRGNAG